MTIPSGWNLGQIMTEVRSITGRPIDLLNPSNNSGISDIDLVTWINQYYQFVLTKELKIFWEYSYYSFYTQAGIDHYKAPTTFQTLNPTVTADGWPICWYISPDTFYQDWPNQETTKMDVATGDGVTNNFSFSLSVFPIMQASLYFTDGTQVAQSTPGGRFFNPVTNTITPGTVNYITGVVTGLGFTNPPAAGTQITATFRTYQANRPQGILFYDNFPLLNSSQTAVTNSSFFIVRPVPDQVYQIKFEGIQVPAALGYPLVGSTPAPDQKTVPFRQDLGPLIALGTSLTIFRNFNQMDQYDQITGEYARYKDIAMQDTYELYIYQRSVPKF